MFPAPLPTEKEAESRIWAYSHFSATPGTRSPTCINIKCAGKRKPERLMACRGCKLPLYCCKGCRTESESDHDIVCAKGGDSRGAKEFIMAILNHKAHSVLREMTDCIIMAAVTINTKGQTAVKFREQEEEEAVEMTPDNEAMLRAAKLRYAVALFRIQENKTPILGPKTHGPSVGMNLFVAICSQLLTVNYGLIESGILLARLMDSKITDRRFQLLTLETGFAEPITHEYDTAMEVYRLDLCHEKVHSTLYLLHLVPLDTEKVREVSLILWRLGPSAFAVSAIHRTQNLGGWLRRDESLHVDKDGYAHLEMSNTLVVERFLADLTELTDPEVEDKTRQATFIRVFSIRPHAFRLSNLLYGTLPQGEFPLYRLQMCRVNF